MKQLQVFVTVTGRVVLCIIFLMAAVGSPHFSEVAQLMATEWTEARSLYLDEFIASFPVRLTI
jgi:hypothetical protein